MTDKQDLSPKTPHAFMAEALGVQTQLLALRRAFLRDAALAEAHALDSGRGLSAADVDRYFDLLAAEQQPTLPTLKPWRS